MLTITPCVAQYNQHSSLSLTPVPITHSINEPPSLGIQDFPPLLSPLSGTSLINQVTCSLTNPLVGLLSQVTDGGRGWERERGRREWGGGCRGGRVVSRQCKQVDRKLSSACNAWSIEVKCRVPRCTKGQLSY